MDAELTRRRAAVSWCGGHHCDRRTRRVFDADTGHFIGPCPDCHPDVVIGLAPTSSPPALPAALAAGGRPRRQPAF